LTTVNDGCSANDIIVSFENKLDFISWLSKENDQSMALYRGKLNNKNHCQITIRVLFG
tara:strand:+ start:2297 stop:2470 length:174 start_codon:yes stop_codon:yes gene_type:complete